jgi:hypothetical protein
LEAGFVSALPFLVLFSPSFQQRLFFCWLVGAFTGDHQEFTHGCIVHGGLGRRWMTGKSIEASEKRQNIEQ